ncbi:3-hydroxybenzoate 6-hydroxylase 1 [Cyphellophora attinorum]|uniref:3-hydroxybenzoate 6-hydroxylase 1 n=1 Tax=Cyphellophora attinorum TaxID=1664694 RepID=A0A0N0NHS7_9EURO|nr:3-hydroxybenzoate 6-hydroxylase 1 [Phialophora attinorum]KPI35031.1 3-hydroxybenzoate 6-hydroxylase 1 [Phialophora attinorum]
MGSAAEPLKVIIIGAGIGGLATASFVRQQGHHVEVYESSKFAKELGAAIHIPPNAHSLLRKIGIDPIAIGANPCTRLTMFASSGFKINSIDTSAGRKWEFPWVLGHRVKLHDALKEAATSAGATLHLSKSATRIDPHQGIVEFDDGTSANGDDSKPFSSGKSAFRFLVPREAVLSDPQTKHYASTDGEMVIVYHADRRLVMYPTSDNSILNFVCIHPEEETASKATGDWNNDATKEMLLDVYRDFHQDFKSILNKSNAESLKIWKLLDMTPLESWSDEKLALLGDAAHPFLPHQGQGGAVAIEDAAALGVLLEAGLRPEDVPDRLSLYEEIRRPRANKLQEYTRLAGEDLKPGQAQKFDVRDYTNYNFDHDEFDNSTKRLKEWKETK